MKKGFLPKIFYALFGEVDLKHPPTLFAYFLVGLAWVCFFSYGSLAIIDLKTPISDISAVAIGESVEPGGIARIELTYTRSHISRVKVEKRRLLCSDGEIYHPVNLNDLSGKQSWSEGKDVKADLFIKIPGNVPEGICWYDSEVRYPRYVLDDIILKILPKAVRINIKNSEKMVDIHNWISYNIHAWLAMINETLIQVPFWNNPWKLFRDYFVDNPFNKVYKYTWNVEVS